MEINDKRIQHAVRNTEVLRAPKQSLYTFGTTNIYYYLVTEPSYPELIETGNVTETVVREGRVTAERPRIVTPYYLSRLEGFSLEARRYFQESLNKYGSNAGGLFYTYSNETKELTIVSDNLPSVVEKLNAEIDKRGDPLAAIIKGENDLWDVSLMKFIFEVTTSSIADNIGQLSRRGLLDMDAAGIPVDARVRINELFSMVIRGERDPTELKEELDRWGLFEEYQDRFFNIFQRRR